MFPPTLDDVCLGPCPMGRVDRESFNRRTGEPALGAIPLCCEGVRELPAMDRLLTAEEIAERLGMRTDWVWA